MIRNSLLRSAAALAALTTACTGEAPTVASPPASVMMVDDHLMLVRLDATSDGVVRIALVSHLNGIDVASLQGELRFDSNRITIVSVHGASVEDGTSRFVNGTELADGRIRFAAFATERISDDALIILHVTGDPEAAMRGMTAELIVMGDSSGQAIVRTSAPGRRRGGR